MNNFETIIDFRDSDFGPWSIVNDGVMGGVSQSQMRRTDQGTGLFSGILSLENNGGFTSTRTSVDTLDLSDRAGLEMRLRGDGRHYQVRLRDRHCRNDVAHRAHFTAPKEWTIVRVAFTDFETSYRGRILTDHPPLDPASIKQLGFLLADKRPGAFNLEIDHVRPW
jgi:Complex I intermediate-associated protein 30 (CIA30)